MTSCLSSLSLVASASTDATISPSIYITLVLALGVIAQWLAWRLKLPSILLLLAFGFSLGHFTGVSIDQFLPDDPHKNPLLPFVGILVAIILFEGGLTLKFSELKESGAPVVRLCTIGVVISFALTVAVCMLLFGYDIRVAGIIGAILTVTGPTVIAPLLRTVAPTKKMSSILKWEGIVVDPIGAILAVLVFQVALSSDIASARASVLESLGMTLLVGIVFALVLAKLIELALHKHLIPDYLQPVFLLGAVAVAFTVSNIFQKEAGLLTVTVLGIALANQKTVSVRHILEFKENLRVLIISCLFIILSGRINSGSLMEILPKALIFIGILIVVIRPLTVLLSNMFSVKTDMKERLFLSFLAPRGIVAAAVASIFALELEEAASQGLVSEQVATQAEGIVSLIFLVIVGTVAFYGLLARPFAKRLGLAATNSDGILFAGADRWALLAARILAKEGHAVMLLDTNYGNVAEAKMEGLEAHRANILSEFAEEEIEFTGIGAVIAGTPNDEVNSLACEHLLHQFGRANLWQLKPLDADNHHSTSVAEHMRGRYCFSDGPTFKDLQHFVRSGAVMKKTLITEKFTLSDFMQLYDNEAIILFLKSEDKGLRPAPTDLDKVAPDTTIFAFVPGTLSTAESREQKAENTAPMGL